MAIFRMKITCLIWCFCWSISQLSLVVEVCTKMDSDVKGKSKKNGNQRHFWENMHVMNFCKC